LDKLRIVVRERKIKIDALLFFFGDANYVSQYAGTTLCPALVNLVSLYLL
jgi:hypothetical protein